PSDHPDLAAWLLNQGIASMSLNPDTVVDTWLMLAAAGSRGQARPCLHGPATLVHRVDNDNGFYPSSLARATSTRQFYLDEAVLGGGHRPHGLVRRRRI
ncbi:MAG TPA: hypothetical protein VGD39_04490, partial [Nocardioides sp.]